MLNSHIIVPTIDEITPLLLFTCMDIDSVTVLVTCLVQSAVQALAAVLGAVAVRDF